MPPSVQKPEIILDISRLLSRVAHPTPTGVDRCEMAYARGLMAAVPDRLRFAAVHPSGFYGRIPTEAVLEFLESTEKRWDHRGFSSVWDMRRFAATALVALRPRRHHRDPDAPRPFYVQASPSNLTKPAFVSSILKRERARLVCLVHDLIPLQYPEYARQGGAEDHEVRIRTILANADGVVCNSRATLDALTPWMRMADRRPTSVVAHLGTHLHRPSEAVSPARHSRPYFVCIGTIEPRKNHLLLLNLWRRMAEERGAETIPKLLIIGRRGWENEQIVDMLERCQPLKQCVEEHGRLSDWDIAKLLPGAKALLMPSFAEGYGMPITEALALGVPAICSDLPALREAGGDVPEYLDPLDGAGWVAAIVNYSLADSHRRKRQLDRMAKWSPPTWRGHMDTVIELVDRLAS